MRGLQNAFAKLKLNRKDEPKTTPRANNMTVQKTTTTTNTKPTTGLKAAATTTKSTGMRRTTGRTTNISNVKSSNDRAPSRSLWGKKKATTGGSTAATLTKKNVPIKAKHSQTITKAPIPTKRNIGSTKKLAPATVPEAFRTANPKRWKTSQHSFSGGVKYTTCGKQEHVKGMSIAKAIQIFQANPGKYVALTYQTSLHDWPEVDQEFTLVHREGTTGYQPQAISKNGWMTIWLHEYQRLPPFPNNELPAKFRDQYTDKMVYKGRKLYSARNKPIMPGRGMGVGDEPNLKIIGDVDPSDIRQGSVGDCWLLSGISSLAEFDGAIKKLFRKTKNLERCPLDGPNTYIVTLWDLPTWTEVDIVIDERLPVMADGSGKLFASRPSEDGELW
jgi:Calpain family cysteine protease